ncbi:MAG: TraB/GumN family protein [Pseudomonadota bacterium]
MLNKVMAGMFALIGFLIGGVLTGLLTPNFEGATTSAEKTAREAAQDVASLKPSPRIETTVDFPVAPTAPETAGDGGFARSDDQHPALWRVSDEDSVLWLFGTVHALREDLDWRFPEYEAAVSEAERFYFESKVEDTAETRKRLRQLERLATYKDTPLTERLSQSGSRRLLRLARRLGLDQSSIIYTRPWQAGLLLGQRLAVRAGMKAEHGVESVLAKRVGDRPTYYLEDGIEVLFNLAAIPEEAQLREFETALEQIDDNPYHTADLQDAWRLGEVDRLSQLAFGSMPVNSQSYAVMMRDRNVAWSEKLRADLDAAGVSFVAVGAAHLIGPDSVQRLLANDGYTVERF